MQASEMREIKGEQLYLDWRAIRIKSALWCTSALCWLIFLCHEASENQNEKHFHQEKTSTSSPVWSLPPPPDEWGQVLDEPQHLLPITDKSPHFQSDPGLVCTDQRNPAVNWCIISCKRCGRKKKIWLTKHLRTRADLYKCFLAIFTKRKQVVCPNYVVPCSPSRTFRKFSFPIIPLSTSFPLLCWSSCCLLLACLLADAQLARNDAEVRHCC